MATSACPQVYLSTLTDADGNPVYVYQCLNYHNNCSSMTAGFSGLQSAPCPCAPGCPAIGRGETKPDDPWKYRLDADFAFVDDVLGNTCWDSLCDPTCECEVLVYQRRKKKALMMLGTKIKRIKPIYVAYDRSASGQHDQYAALFDGSKYGLRIGRQINAVPSGVTPFKCPFVCHKDHPRPPRHHVVLHKLDLFKRQVKFHILGEEKGPR
jgi:hypothetical protein